MENNQAAGGLALANAISGVLRPAVEEIDACVARTRQSQIDFRHQIDVLAEQIQSIGQAQNSLGNLDVFTKKLSNINRKLTIIDNILQNVQFRMNNLEHSVVNEAESKQSNTAGLPTNIR